MSPRVPVTVLGATGVVGQRFVRRLVRHPWFMVAHLAASEKSAGKRYRDACSWRLPADDGEPWGGLGDVVLEDATADSLATPIVFSALDAGPARELEPALAKQGALVFSNASAFRMDADVPLVVPEVNAAHVDLLATQRQARGWTGGIVCNPNCTATVLVMALAPLERAFGVEAVAVTSLQALSGAGFPGVSALDAIANVIPYIANEEAKLEEETKKMLGRLAGGRVEPSAALVSASCNRVPVVDGHVESVSVRLRGAPGVAAVRRALAEWRPGLDELPSAPRIPLVLHDADDRPQPRKDVEAGGGLPVHVGRIRPCPILGIKMTVLGHNAERGAAGASVLNAELARVRGHWS